MPICGLVAMLSLYDYAMLYVVYFRCCFSFIVFYSIIIVIARVDNTKEWIRVATVIKRKQHNSILSNYSFFPLININAWNMNKMVEGYISVKV